MEGIYCGLAVFLAGIAVLGPPVVRIATATCGRVRKIAFVALSAAVFFGVLKASIWTGLDLRAAYIDCASPTGKGLVMRGYPYPPAAHDPLRAHLMLLLVCFITGVVTLYRIIARPRRGNVAGGLAGIGSAAMALPAFLPCMPMEGDAAIFVYLLIFPLFVLGQGLLVLLSIALLVRTFLEWRPTPPSAKAPSAAPQPPADKEGQAYL